MKRFTLTSLIFLFVVAHGLGLFLAYQFKKAYITSAFPQFSWWWGLVYFFLATILVLLVIRVLKNPRIPVSLKTLSAKIVPKFISVLLILFTSQIIFGFFFTQYLVLLIAAVAISCYFFIPRVWIFNLIMIMGMVALGSLYGFFFSPWGIVGILFVIAIYDLLAVYKTKHMIVMAEAILKSQIFFGLLIPKRSFLDFNTDSRKAQLDILCGLTEERKPARFFLFGGGDLFFPLLLMVSVFNAHGIVSALIVAGFSTAGLVLSYFLYIAFKEKPAPALPPIVLLAITGFAVSLLV